MITKLVSLVTVAVTKRYKSYRSIYTISPRSMSLCSCSSTSRHAIYLSTDLASKVVISGAVLSLLIEEMSYNDGGHIEGLLFGREIRKTESDCSDSDENKVKVLITIGIIRFLSFRGRKQQGFDYDVSCANRNDIIGVFSLRRDNYELPSVRDMIFARSISQMNSIIRNPIILIVNTSRVSNTTSWLLGLQYSCFISSSTKGPEKLPIDVLSIATDGVFTFKSQSVYRQDETGDAHARKKAAEDVVSCASTIMYAVEILSQVQEEIRQVVELEAEIDVLKKQLSSSTKISVITSSSSSSSYSS